MKRLFLIVIIASQFFISGCNKSGDCPFGGATGVASAAEISAIQDYLTTNSITAIKHSSGIFYQINNAGTGSTAGPCAAITIQYVGRLTNGTVFDESSSPVTFTLGQLIVGWQIGIPLIKSGGTIKLFIPPSLGYGSSSSGPIPANSILIFDIALLGVN